MTFSIVALDGASGDLGCAVQSKFLAVGAAVIYAEAGVGAVATQALADISFGPTGLKLLREGTTAAGTLEQLLSADERPERRQVGVVGRSGLGAAHTGSDCMPVAAHQVGEGFACQGNSLASLEVVTQMAQRYLATAQEPFADRLIGALVAAQEAGGDRRGQQSAALLVVRTGGGYGGKSDRLIDLRVDDHERPISELKRLLGLHRLYFQRPTADDLMAMNPSVVLEISTALEMITGEPFPTTAMDRLWTGLERWAGRENLEERILDHRSIDRHLLTMLTAAAKRASTPFPPK